MKDWLFELNLMAAIKLEKAGSQKTGKDGKMTQKKSVSLYNKNERFWKRGEEMDFSCFVGNFSNSHSESTPTF